MCAKPSTSVPCMDKVILILRCVQSNHPVWKAVKEFAEDVRKTNADKEAKVAEIKKRDKQAQGPNQGQDPKPEDQIPTQNEMNLNAEFLEKTEREISDLVEILWEFDRGEIYASETRDEKDLTTAVENKRTKNCFKKQQDKPRVLSTYNICGDKALHICMLMAYSSPEKSQERMALLEVVRQLIHKHKDRWVCCMCAFIRIYVYMCGRMYAQGKTWLSNRGGR
jgi:hypothetical protein